MKEANILQAEMMENILGGGAWFATGREKYIKIGYSKTDGCYFARECELKNGTMECKAYSFGTDWFDISFHGKYIDIYSDPDTFKTWEVWYDEDKGTQSKSNYKSIEIAKRIVDFCEEADLEALTGIENPYVISGTNFDFLAERTETILNNQYL